MSVSDTNKVTSDWMAEARELTLRLDYLLMGITGWSYLVIGVHPAFRGKKFLLLFIALILITRWLYRTER